MTLFRSTRSILIIAAVSAVELAVIIYLDRVDGPDLVIRWTPQFLALN